MSKRECGECGECCFALAVDVEDKPRMKACPHFCSGCSIYDNRPESCAEWNCLWLMGSVPHSQRPDRTKIIFWLPDTETAGRWGNRLVMAAETKKSAYRMQSNEKYIRHLHRQGNNIMLLHVDGSRTLYLHKEFMARVLVDSKRNGVIPSMTSNKITFTSEQAEKIRDQKRGQEEE